MTNYPTQAPKPLPGLHFNTTSLPKHGASSTARIFPAIRFPEASLNMAPSVKSYRQIHMALNVCAFEDYLEAQMSRLPRLLDVEQISPRVIRVLGKNPGKFSLQGTNTYIVGTGPERLIIDTGQGIPEWADLISRTLSNEGFSLSHVLLTHWHEDHTGGVPDLVRMYPHLRTAIYKHSPSRVQQPIADGQIFRVEGATVRAVHAPGHSHDHMCFILEEENAMFTGDNMLGHGTAAVEHLRTWMDSLRKMQSHGCTKGYPAHGAVINDLKARIDGELTSKIRREQMILQALRPASGNAARGRGGRARLTVQEVVSAVYGRNVEDRVKQRALEPFLQEVLSKLAEDGKVGFEVKGGIKRWFLLTSS